MDYQVIWQDDAISDLRKALQFIARHNPAAAKRTGPPYRIIDLVQDSACIVTILSVWHGARQEPEELPGV